MHLTAPPITNYHALLNVKRNMNLTYGLIYVFVIRVK